MLCSSFFVNLSRKRVSELLTAVAGFARISLDSVAIENALKFPTRLAQSKFEFDESGARSLVHTNWRGRTVGFRGLL